jgi:hypothetical protein
MRSIAPALAALLVLAAPALAEDLTHAELTIKDHKFTPTVIQVPAGKPVLLTIRNEDGTAEEFDSTALKTEKVIAGGTQGTVRLRPLAPGRFPFMGEYHADTAQGMVIAQ